MLRLPLLRGEVSSGHLNQQALCPVFIKILKMVRVMFTGCLLPAGHSAGWGVIILRLSSPTPQKSYLPK